MSSWKLKPYTISMVGLNVIGDIAKKNPDLPNDFTTRHIPIANDAAGNQYWVDLFSGKVLFIETEYDFPEGLHVVADCFCTFYSNLRPML